MKPRPLKPFSELDRLSDTDRAQLWLDLHTGLSYTRAVRILAKEHFVYIRRHRLFRWWQLEHDRRQLNANIPSESHLTAGQFLDLLNGQSLPWADLMHTRILQAGYLMIGSGDQTPSRLVTLQRIANNQFNQQIAREKLELAKRSLAVRQTQMELKRSFPNPNHTRNLDPDQSFKMWTPDEIVSNQPKIEAAIQADPLLRQIGLPPSSAPTDSSSQTSPSPVAASLQGAQNIEDRSSRREKAHESQCQMENAQSAMLNENNENGSQATSVSSDSSAVSSSSVSSVRRAAKRANQDLQFSSMVNKSRPSLEQRVNDYTLARYFEALDGRDTNKVGRWAAYKFKTKLQHCPCGEQELPCPHHGDFPNLFWEASPDSADYFDVLRARNLPYTAPALLLQERDRQERRAAALKCAPTPDALLRSATSHAIRRWRSHTPRPLGSPPPDESWTEECPCGAPHPCDLHPDLWREVRYIKPSHPDYAGALKREGIPVYTPTPDDLDPKRNLNHSLNHENANER
jgi:hypothetical protein